MSTAHGNEELLSSVELALLPEADREVLVNLMEHYLHDFSELLPLEINENGKFGPFPIAPEHFEAGKGLAYLIRVQGKIAGCILAKKGSVVSGDPAVWDVTEFLVLRKYRRTGVGRKAAHLLWTQHPEIWEVRVNVINERVLPFWSGAISAFLKTPCEYVYREKPGKRWQVYSLDSRNRATN